jgi:hypothetical protein
LQAGSSSKKGNVLNTSPFYWIKPPAGLTDWHWALPGFFCFRNGAIFSGAQHPSWTVSWLRGKWPCMQTRSERVLPHPDDPCEFDVKSV